MVEDYYGYARGLVFEFKVVTTGFVLFCFFLNERRLSYNMMVSCRRRFKLYPCHFRLFELSLCYLLPGCWQALLVFPMIF